jgi:protoporphyrinogen oxidase
MRGRFFDYPLRPGNAVFGLGLTTVLRILADYASLKLRPRNGEAVTLEDWVVGRFGRTMFNLYFKEYSEKIWGLDCSQISQRWVSQRIRGLSLGTALKNAFFRFTGKEIPTLADAFLYPELGIGRIAERFSEEIAGENTVLTDAAVSAIRHGDSLITGLEVTNCANTCQVEGRDYISTIPLNVFVGMMEPQPPPEVLRAARSLRYRDLITVAVTVDRESVTDQTWVYIPEQKYPFGRLHEPKAWSRKMARPGAGRWPPRGRPWWWWSTSAPAATTSGRRGTRPSR